MGRKKPSKWRWRIAGVLALLLAAGGGWAWWQSHHWMPPRADFPMQGALVSAADGEVDFAALSAIGADFVYVEASEGGSGRDAMLGANLRRLADTDLPYGAVHVYDPCVAADRQAANFVTIVPRGGGQLPPVIALDALADHCEDPMMETAVESELTTFVNQVESHAGQQAILKLSPAFEERYHIASRIERSLWLDSAFVQPDYAGRPWTLWTANPELSTQAAPGALRWVVAQP